MTMHVRVSGNWQEVTAPQVKVSGVWHAVQEGWVKVSGVWQQFFAAVTYLLDATGTAGTDGTNPGYTLAGYGSMSPTSVTGGGTVIGIRDLGGSILQLVVSGFGGDPGQTGWNTGIIVDGNGFLFSAASNYAYDGGSGQAAWEWAAPGGFVNGVGFTLQVY